MVERVFKKAASSEKTASKRCSTERDQSARFLRVFGSALLSTSSLCLPSTAFAGTPAPAFTDVIDDLGVDLATGLPSFSMEEGGIGSGPGRVAMQRIYSEGAGWTDNWSGGLYPVTANSITKMYVQFGTYSDSFSGSGSSWTSDKGDGATLVKNGDNSWTYTGRDGTQIKFNSTATENTGDTCPGGDDSAQCHVPTLITRPDGLKFTLGWDIPQVCTDPPTCNYTYYDHRLRSVTSSAGYRLDVTYQSNTVGDSYWFLRTGVTFTNTANPPGTLPTISYAYPAPLEIDVTDAAGGLWVFSMGVYDARLRGVRRPGSAADNISYSYPPTSGATITSATKDGVTNTYARTISGSIATETVTDPLSNQVVVTTDTNVGRPSSYKDELNRTTAYEYDPNQRLAKITAPEGNYVQYGYDSRGNLNSTTYGAKPGSGLANITTSASFDATCANVVKCNQPNSTTDGKGNVTDYVYDATHGGLTSVTRPAPQTGGVRPQTRYGYTQVTSANGDLVYMPTSISACQTSASCTGSADETKVTATYNSNLLPTGVTRKNGTGTLTSSSVLTYNSTGTLNTIDGPLTGTADTTKYRYDILDRLVGITSPDPDGAGSLKNRAIRLTYRGDSQVSKWELGTVNSQSDADWSLFAPLDTVDITFDANSRPTRRKLSSGSTAYALTQTDYDALGRVNCVAIRMNPGFYSSLPASACTLSTQGSYGPDQIRQLVYDPTSEVTQINVGVAMGDAAAERTLTYSNDGLVTSLKDAENNLTTYEYDGFNRLSKIRYPSPTKGAGTSSTTDYEQLLSYDANSNPGSRRLRNGTSIAFTYNNLNRVTAKNLPGTEPDVSYAYDNLGRLTSASQTGSSLTFGWDALSRKTSEAITANGATLTTTFAYDAANRRTSVTYPSATALTVSYAYLTTGELDTIKQGAVVLADYTYDNLGNRTAAAFEGASQAFTYDPVSRLSQLTNDLGGTSNDLTATFNYNPASQITQTVRTGNAYPFGGTVAVNRSYSSNGLNQYTSAGSATFTHDSKGNLTSDGTSNFGYSSENLLTSGPGSNTLTYDPEMRLYQVAGASTTRFLYDGTNMIAEYDGTNALQRRFVFDPTTGQPVVWYEGNGTGSSNRRYFSLDERGSVISVSNNNGANLGINSYDEYGISASSNIGRFGYTGQAWLGEIGLQYSRARIYSPTMGRFMQPDPIGYADNANSYAYVNNDAVNYIDPLGLGTEVLCPDGLTAPSVSECPIDINGTRLPPEPALLVVVAVNDSTGPNVSDGPGMLEWIFEQIKAGYNNRKNKPKDPLCTPSNISQAQVNQDMKTGAKKNLVRGGFLAIIGELIDPAGGGLVGAAEIIASKTATRTVGAAALSGIASAAEQCHDNSGQGG
jgi:RHS repeat-associated protein